MEAIAAAALRDPNPAVARGARRHRPNHRLPFDNCCRLHGSLFDRLDAAVALLRRWPMSGAALDGSGPRRKLRVRRTPYVLLYQVRPSAIGIVRVVHAAQDWRTVL